MKHSIHQVSELLVGENYSDHPFFHNFWKLLDRGLSLGDMPLVTPDCDWTAGSPVGDIAWHRHDEVINSLEKDELNASTREILLAESKPHTESFVLYESPSTSHQPLSATSPVRKSPLLIAFHLSRYSHIDISHTGECNPRGSVLLMCNLLVAPISRGALKLHSSKPEDPPLLDPNILSNNLDLQLLYSVGRLTMAMMQGTVGQKYGAQEYGIEESICNDTSDAVMRKRLLKQERR
jgi:hypothetical protein